MEPNNPFFEQELNIREYLHVIYRKRWLILSITVVLCTLTLMHSFMMKPVYRATTRVLIQRESPRVVNIEEVAPADYAAREYYQTQINILESRALAERVNKAVGGYTPWSEWSGRREKEYYARMKDDIRAKALLKRVEINPVPGTQLVEIDIEDIKPKLATTLANLWAENYISYILDTKFDASEYASGWLQTKIEEARKKLEDSESRLQEYREKNKTTVDLLDKETTVLQRLLERKSELEVSLSENLEYYKEKHPEIIGIRSELDSIDKKIETEKDKALRLKNNEIQYNILKREVDTNREIYESLLMRVGETEVMGELRTTNIRIIDKALVPRRPVKPRKKLNFIIALFVGVFSGTILAFLFESLDQSIKTPEDIKNYTKLPALASIALPQEEEDKQTSPEFITVEKPHSTISESYRSLRTSIMFTAVEHRRKTLLLTSSGPKEGKTTNAVNLAIVMAQAGEKVILLDADLRQPRIEKVFNITPGRGLTEVLAGGDDLDNVIRKTDIPNLDIMPCGSIPPNPSELLGSGKMDDLLRTLQEKYDRIILDTPPVLAVTDSVVLSAKMDGTILVVKAGETNRNAVLKTKEILETVSKSTSLIGVVLNMVESGRTGGYYYYYHYYGKYGKYGDKTGGKKSTRRKEQPSDTNT